MVTITAQDWTEAPAAGAVVSGTFQQGSTSWKRTCTTDASGRCHVDSGVFPSPMGSASFTVSDVAAGTLVYHPFSNHDPDGDSNGTTINLAK